MVLHLDKLSKLHEPENYMEKQGFETRITINKFLGFEETIRHANLSLVYANKEEYTKDTYADRFVRKSHLRHAILDLNNSFDLLLQVPWFYYRIWESFNPSSQYQTEYLKNNIQRNTIGWVFEAEKACSGKKVIEYIKNQRSTNRELRAFYKELNAFTNRHIKTSNPFSIRNLANQMKHNNSLIFEEFETPMTFKVTLNGKTYDLQKEGLKLELNQGFVSSYNPHEKKGEIRLSYSDKLSVDINYINGEQFNSLDYMRLNKTLSMDTVYANCDKFGNELLDLYQTLYNLLSPNFDLLPMLNDFPQVQTSENAINLDSYFKPTEI